MDAAPLCPSPLELRFEHVTYSGDVLIVRAAACRRTVTCPACGRATGRIHSRYRRTLADLPWHGLRVRLELSVRRFFCDAPGCRRRIFTERLPKTAAPYARHTARAAAALEAIAFAIGGRPGSRLARVLGLRAGAATLLARVRRAPDPERGTPRVLGVDDWAMRRGQRYGTILIDLERHTVIDLLPDRDAATLAAWLGAHPGVEIISRDRGGAYAEGARAGAPDAVQVADRFHVMRNLVDALERACTRHHAVLRAAAELTRPKPVPRAAARKRRYSGLPNNTAGPTGVERRGLERRARRVARYEQVIALRAAGTPKSRIARTVGLDRRTVDTWLAAGHFPERAPRGRQPHRLDPFAAYILERYEAGLDSAAQLARELRTRGFTGSYQAASRYLAELRRTRPRGAPGEPLPSAAAGPTPSPRETAWLLRRADAEPNALRHEERAYVDAVCAACPALDRAQTLATEFVQLVERRDANALDPWLTAAGETDLRAFAAGLRRDRDAVLAAIVFPWSNGQVEGQVHRLKLVKRSMYGRAGFALLRKRVLHAA